MAKMQSNIRAWTPAVREWRERLSTAYLKSTKLYLEIKDPELLNTGGLRLVRALSQIGRAGLELDIDEHTQLKQTTRDRHKRLDQSRRRVSKALDSLLERKPIRTITVGELTEKDNRAPSSFYAAFANGLIGAYCYWATEQLNLLSAESRDQIQRDIKAGLSGKKLLRNWSDLASRFFLDRPYGRPSIMSFLLFEIDEIGASLITARNDDSHPEDTADHDEVIAEFVDLAASFHRASARVVHELEAVFRTPDNEFRRKGGLATMLWPKDGEASWNLAVSFWQTIHVNRLAVGLLERERVPGSLRRFVFEAWCNGASRLVNKKDLES